MRMRLGCVAVLVLASLSCSHDAKEEAHAERFACPSELTPVVTASPKDGPSLLYDTEDDDYDADLRIYVEGGRPRRAEVDTTVGTFLVQYGERGAISWEELPRAAGVAAGPNEPAPAPLELAPPELSKLIPDLQPPVASECLAQPAVSYYLGELRDRLHSRWVAPALDEGASRNIAVLFSLSASGEVTGACFKSAAAPGVGASAIRALQRAAPYDPMSEETECLAGRRLTGNFTVR